MPSDFHSSAHWVKLEVEARVVAAQMTDPETKKIMLGIADRYGLLAKLATARERGTKPG